MYFIKFKFFAKLSPYQSLDNLLWKIRPRRGLVPPWQTLLQRTLRILHPWVFSLPHALLGMVGLRYAIIYWQFYIARNYQHLMHDYKYSIYHCNDFIRLYVCSSSTYWESNRRVKSTTSLSIQKDYLNLWLPPCPLDLEFYPLRSLLYRLLLHWPPSNPWQIS